MLGGNISFLNLKEEDIKQTVLTNYGLIIIEGAFAFLVYWKYNVWPWQLVAYVALAILIANLLLHLSLITMADILIKEMASLFLSIVVVVSLTAFIHYLPEARSALLLVYIPTIIFSATLSLSYGITNVGLIIISFLTLIILEFYKLPPYADSPVNIGSMGTLWTVAVIFSFFFLMILAFLANYFMEILRKRERKIQELAELNKNLYQRSKTTSDEIIKNMGEGLVVVDKDFKIVKYNQAFKQIIDEKSDLINSDIGTLPIVFSARLKAYLQHMLRDKVNNFTFKARDKMKHIFNVNITTIDLKENERGFLILLEQKLLPWGTIFNSATKAPIDLAAVRLYQADGSKKLVETKVTDQTGRFGFIVPEGEYYITAEKEGYDFPSKSKTEGYRGEKFTISAPEEAYIRLNIPLDKK